MKVTAWNNGEHHQTGAGYGLKLSASDRDRYFRESWGTVLIHLPDGVESEVNTDKASFWNESCRELISQEIGRWLIKTGKAPWPGGNPPKFELIPKGERHFELREGET